MATLTAKGETAMPNFAIGAVLDTARARHGLKSDYALCKRLGCSTQLVANWRHGRALPDEKACRALAELADLDPLVLAAQVQAQRSKSTEARTLWEAVALRLSHASAGLAAAIFSVLIATSFVATEARAASAGEGADPHFVERISLYIVSTAWGLLFVILAALAMRFDSGFLPLFAPQP